MRVSWALVVSAAIITACGSSGDTSGGGDGGAASGIDGGTGSSDDGGVVFLGDAGGRDSGLLDGGPPGGALYTDMQAKASHNSYTRDEPLFDQLFYHRVHGLELDIHNGKGAAAPAGDFYVYHVDIPTQDGTSCKMLSDCLRIIRAFHESFPQHEVITIFVDRKDAWDDAGGHGPADLDAAAKSALDPSWIYSPKDLLAACPAASTLRDSVGAKGQKPGCAFPTLASLRGKIVFGVTGGDGCTAGSDLLTYVGADPKTRTMFIAPEIVSGCTVQQYDAVPNAVLLNMASALGAQAKDVNQRGLISRVYDVNDSAGFGVAKSAGANVLATDKVNAEQDTWSTTANAKGFPFVCLRGGCDTLTEAGAVVGASVLSGDIDGTSDSFFSASMPSGGSTTATWQASFSVASSHVTEYAKGCLMARATLEADSPYFALCRPADAHPMRVQYRTAKGTSTTIVEGTAPTGFSSESLFFGKVALAPNAGGVTASAQVSIDGKTWVTVTQASFAAPLPVQGLAVSGHDSATAVTFLFGNLSLDGKVLAAKDVSTQTKVGATAASLWDGFHAP